MRVISILQGTVRRDRRDAHDRWNLQNRLFIYTFIAFLYDTGGNHLPDSHGPGSCCDDMEAGKAYGDGIQHVCMDDPGCLYM